MFVSTASRSRLRAAPQLCPRFVEPMLAQAGSPDVDGGWGWEVKWDGMRAQLRVYGGELCVRSRTGRDFTAGFPELAELVAAAPAAALLLDGELVCLADDGTPDFGLLRGRLLARTPAAVERAAAAARSATSGLRQTTSRSPG